MSEVKAKKEYVAKVLEQIQIGADAVIDAGADVKNDLHPVQVVVAVIEEYYRLMLEKQQKELSATKETEAPQPKKESQLVEVDKSKRTYH